MSIETIKFEVELGPKSIGALHAQTIATTNIALAIAQHLTPSLVGELEKIADKLSALIPPPPIVTFIYSTKLNFDFPKGDNTMADLDFSFEDDKPDFVVPISLEGLDSEGHAVHGIKVPEGAAVKIDIKNTLDATIPAQISVDTTDPMNPKFSIGGPNDDGTPAPVTLTLRLAAADDSDLFPPIVKNGEVTVGKPKTISSISFPFPAN